MSASSRRDELTIEEPELLQGWREIVSNERELTNDELDVVSGGAEFVITKLTDVSVSGGGGGGGATPTSAWNTLLYQYGYIK